MSRYRRFESILRVVAISVLSIPNLAFAEERPSLTCDVGPVEKTFGNTQWIVYSCNDDRSVLVVAAPNSPASPFVFMFAAQEAGYQLRGEGTGQKEITAAAYEELKNLAESDIKSLVEQTQAHAKQLANNPDVTVESLSNGRYLLTLTKYQNIPVDAGQRELLATARALCKDQEVQYGKYKFKSQEQVGSKPGNSKGDLFVLKQEVSCGTAAKGVNATATEDASSAANRTPGAHDDKLIERLTYQYFSAKDTGKYKDAYARLTDSMQDITPFDRWRTAAENFNSMAGKVRKRAIKKITWYNDPPSSAPGVYAAVDFGSSFDNVRIHCGYVAWRQEGDGSFRVVREEQNYIDMKAQQGQDEKSLAAVKAKFGAGCESP